MILLILVCFLFSSTTAQINQDCSTSFGGRLVFRQVFNFDRSQSAYNPLRGFVPYCCTPGNLFPASMENFYVGMKYLMNGPSSFTFNNSIEQNLRSAASRNHHSIVRVYVEYPGITRNISDGVPAYLVNGLNFTYYPTCLKSHPHL